MANAFTSNQVNHMYVVKNDLISADSTITPNSNKGSIQVKTDVDGIKYFKYRGGSANIQRSDLLTNIEYIRVTPAGKMARPLMRATITANSNTGSGFTPIVGEDYVLGIHFINPIGISPNNKYYKNAVVHVLPGMDASTFYEKLKESIELNMSRDAYELVDVALVGTSGSYTGITITEHYNADNWILGVKQDKPLVFQVVTREVKGEVWGTVTMAPSGVTIGNGKLAADMEFFSMRERGDRNGLLNYPDCWFIEYVADPTKVYDTIGVHYSYIGSNHSVQKSEKDVTILVERPATDKDATTASARTIAIANAIVPGTIAGE